MCPSPDRAQNDLAAASRSAQAAPPVSRICNHELYRLLPMAAPAANLQQNFSYWLKHEPGAAAGLDRVGAARPASAACYES
jgi:hypothetical protein